MKEKRMKTNPLLFLLLAITLSACLSTKQLTHKGSPVIKAKSDYTEYKIGDDWFRGQWSIAPHVEHDTLHVQCYSSNEAFEFRTDIDSIQFEIGPDVNKSFYVQMEDNSYAHTIITGVGFRSTRLSFDQSRNASFTIKYQTEKSKYLEELKRQFPLDFINDEMSDSAVILAVLNWTNSRWNHNGNNSPSKNDAITILNEVLEGQQFPCFAYAIVLRDQLSALGYKARTVYLKTQDAETRKSPAGHVVTEVYLNDLQKWVLLDGQFNVIPFLNDVPLNAVEFQDAIGNHYDEFELRTLSTMKTTKKNYVNFIYDYLYYFDTTLDNRYEKDKKHLINDKRSIMLVPIGAKKLTHVGFWNMDVDYCIYTNSLGDFYAIPN